MSLDLQAAFDKAYTGIIAQGGPAVTKGGMCRYRTVDGLRCAVGQLLPVDTPADLLDWQGGINNMEAPNAARLRSLLGASGADIPFLRDLQYSHDTQRDMDDYLEHFRSRMLDLARDYNLSSTVLYGPQGQPA